jgi:hypothetical protein
MRKGTATLTFAEQDQAATRSGSRAERAAVLGDVCEDGGDGGGRLALRSFVHDSRPAAGGDEARPVLVDAPVLDLLVGGVADAVDEDDDGHRTRRLVAGGQVEVELARGEREIFLHLHPVHAGRLVDDAWRVTSSESWGAARSARPSPSAARRSRRGTHAAIVAPAAAGLRSRQRTRSDVQRTGCQNLRATTSMTFRPSVATVTGTSRPERTPR